MALLPERRCPEEIDAEWLWLCEATTCFAHQRIFLEFGPSFVVAAGRATDWFHLANRYSNVWQAEPRAHQLSFGYCPSRGCRQPFSFYWWAKCNSTSCKTTHSLYWNNFDSITRSSLNNWHYSYTVWPFDFWARYQIRLFDLVCKSKWTFKAFLLLFDSTRIFCSWLVIVYSRWCFVLLHGWHSDFSLR
jgi:hypothetical protein